jgi:fructose-1,6-bisphosphatase II
MFVISKFDIIKKKGDPMSEIRFEQSATKERNLAMELVRVTEAGALSAGRWMGKGDKVAVDQAAVNAMRQALDGVDMHGVVVIGEGEKDEAPMLYIGEIVGNGTPPEVDVAVDPVDGTRLTSLGLPGAIAVVATAERGTMYSAPPGVFYMEKIAVGPDVREVIDINAPITTNLKNIARTRHAQVDDLTVVILDRPRHAEMIKEIRQAGARIRLIMDGDVSAAIQAAMEDYRGVDVLIGTGGAPEAVLAAAAIKCIGGEIQCKIWPRSDEEREQFKADGIDLNKVYRTDDLVKGNDVSFAATGITSGELVNGVQYFGWGARTSSVMMRSHSGTVRYIEARHKWRKAGGSVGMTRIS